MTSPTTDRRYGVSGNLGMKAPVRAASLANLTLSAEQTVDAVALVADDRVLVKDQTNGVENGIYVVSTGAWTRDIDWNGTRDVSSGTMVTMSEGSQANQIYSVTTTGTITPGTTSIAFAEKTDYSLTASLASATDVTKGDALVGVKHTATGAVARTQHDKNLDAINAFDFMTTAQKADVRAHTGSVDVTAALQAAIDHLASYTASGVSPSIRSQGGGTVYLSEGTYLLNASVTVPQNITLQGAGKGATYITFGGASTNVFLLDYTTVATINQKKINISIRDMSIDGGAYTNVGIMSDNAEGLQLSNFSNLAITRCEVGIRIEGGWINSFTDVDISDCIYGFVGISTASGVGFNANVFQNVTCQRMYRTGMFINGNTNLVDGCVFQFAAFDAGKTAPTNTPSHAFPVGLEVYGTDTVTLLILGTRTSQTTVSNNYFEGIIDSANTGCSIYLDNVDQASSLPLLRLTSIHNNYFANSTEIAVSVNDAYLTEVAYNTFIGSVTDIALSSTANKTIIKSYLTPTITDASSGDYTIEYFDASGIEHKQGRQVAVDTNASVPVTLARIDSGKHLFNTAGTGTFNLPAITDSAQLGLTYTISASAAATITLQPDAADRVCPALAGVAMTNTSGAIGDSVTLRCVKTANPSQWHIISSFGTWST